MSTTTVPSISSCASLYRTPVSDVETRRLSSRDEPQAVSLFEDRTRFAPYGVNGETRTLSVTLTARRAAAPARGRSPTARARRPSGSRPRSSPTPPESELLRQLRVFLLQPPAEQPADEEQHAVIPVKRPREPDAGRR